MTIALERVTCTPSVVLRQVIEAWQDVEIDVKVRSWVLFA